MTRPRRFVILTAAVGAGHLSAAAAVQASLEAADGTADIVVVDALLHLGRPLRIVLLTLYRWQLDHAPWLFGLLHGTLRRRPTAGASWRRGLGALGGRSLRRALDTAAPDLVISTYPPATCVLGELSRRGRIAVPLCATITDVGGVELWAHPHIDLHLVAHPSSESAVERIAGAGRARAVRPLVHPRFLTPLARDDARRVLELPVDHRLVLVSGGGWGVGDLVGAIGIALEEPDCRVVCVTGHNESAREMLSTRFATDDRVTILGFTDRMNELLAAADVLVHSTGGVTVLEAVARGCSVVAFGATGGHFSTLSRSMTELGLASAASTPAELRHAIAATRTENRPGHAALLALPHAADEIRALLTAKRPASEPVSRRREPILAAMISGVAALVVAVAPTPGGDAAAHLYRTLLVQHGNYVWDNLWFAGSYPTLSYSLLYYLPASLVPNIVVGAVSVVTAAVLFASLLQRRWPTAAAWPARAFALLVTGQLFTGAYPFDAGLAALMASLWAISRRRVGLACLTAVLTIGFSPLAFFFLVLAATGMAIHERAATRRNVVYGGVLTLLAGGQLLMAAALGAARLVYPFQLWRLAAGIAVAGAGFLLARRSRESGPVAVLFVVWSVASLLAFVIPSPIGQNTLRASVFVVPLVLLAAKLQSYRPRLLAMLAVAAALSATTVPYLTMIPTRTDDAMASASFWQPTIDFIRRHASPDFRVEVVPTSNHWEAYYVSRAGLPLARGWYRQLDMADNAPLYAQHLPPGTYRRWLRHEGVRYVVLPNAPLEAIDAQREAALVRSPGSGLRLAWRSRDATVYELPHATPIVTGSARAAVTSMTSSSIRGYTTRPGTYFLRVHYTPDWTTTGGVCVEPAADSTMTELVATRGGGFTLTAAELPLSLLSRLVDESKPACAAPAKTPPGR